MLSLCLLLVMIKYIYLHWNSFLRLWCFVCQNTVNLSLNSTKIKWGRILLNSPSSFPVPFPPSLSHSLPSFSSPNPKSPHLLTLFLLPHLSTIFHFSSPTPSSLHSPSSSPGHGQCNCGRCDCKEGWMGKKCEHPLSCSLSLESSLKKCKGTSNMPCFGRGTENYITLQHSTVYFQSFLVTTVSMCFLRNCVCSFKCWCTILELTEQTSPTIHRSEWNPFAPSVGILAELRGCQVSPFQLTGKCKAVCVQVSVCALVCLCACVLAITLCVCMWELQCVHYVLCLQHQLIKILHCL